MKNLGKRRNQIKERLVALETVIGEVERDTIDQSLVTQALTDFSEVFAEIKPYQQKELMRLVLHKAILGPDYVKIALYGRPPEIGPVSEAGPRFQTLKWLPGQMSESAILWDSVAVVARPIARGHVRLSLPPRRSVSEWRIRLYTLQVHFLGRLTR